MQEFAGGMEATNAVLNSRSKRYASGELTNMKSLSKSQSRGDTGMGTQSPVSPASGGFEQQIALKGSVVEQTKPEVKFAEPQVLEENEMELAKILFRIFKVENEAQHCKVVNMLEVFTALILLADFSSQAEIKTNEEEGRTGLDKNSHVMHISAAERLQAFADMIEHKVNLMVLLFTFRDNATLNISEIIIMAKTAISALHRVLPHSKLFSSPQVHEEIKTLMMSLFQKRIDDQLKAEKQARQLQQERSGQKAAKMVAALETPIGTSTTRKKGSGGPINEMSPNFAIGGANVSANVSISKRITNEQSDLYHNESIEDKKERLFKWNAYQTIRFHQEQIKESLIQNINVLRFFNLQDTFDSTLLVWGSNESFQFGLCLKRDLQKFYQIHSSSQVELKIQQDQILAQIMNLRYSQPSTTLDQQSMGIEQLNSKTFLAEKEALRQLMNLWQQSIIQDENKQLMPSNSLEVIAHEIEGAKTYERKMVYQEPSLLSALLNTPIQGIFANKKFCVFLSESGLVYSTGYDFRFVKREDLYGIPRQLSIEGTVIQVGVGKDHALILTETHRVYAFGSNLYGQLGVNKNTGLHYHLHPLTKQRLYYAAQPVEIGFFSHSAEATEGDIEGVLDIYVKQVACGDYYSLAVSTNGDVYSWGVGTYGQLGITLRKGMITNLIEYEGIKYSKAVNKIKVFEDDPCQEVFTGQKHTFAVTKSGNYYFWGQNHCGLALEPSKRVIEEPVQLPQMNKYCFSDMVTSHDHALAIGSTIQLQFVFTELHDNPELFIPALHVHDGEQITDTKTLMDMISQYKHNEPVSFLNDFDIPYVNIRSKYPRLKKKPKRKRERREDDDGQDSHEEEHEDAHDDDDDDDEKEEGEGEEAQSKKSGEEEDEDASPKKKDDDEDGEADDDDGDDSKKKQSSALDKRKSSGLSKKKSEGLQRKKTKRKKLGKKKGKKGDSDEESSEVEEKAKPLTPLQEKEKVVQDYMKGLDQKKNYFKDIASKIPDPILEAGEDEENEDEEDASPGKRSDSRSSNAKASEGRASKLSEKEPKRQKTKGKKQDDSDEEDSEEEDTKAKIKKKQSSSKVSKAKSKAIEEEDDEEPEDEEEEESPPAKKKSKKVPKKKKGKKKADSDEEEESEEQEKSEEEEEEVEETPQKKKGKKKKGKSPKKSKKGKKKAKKDDDDDEENEDEEEIDVTDEEGNEEGGSDEEGSDDDDSDEDSDEEDDEDEEDEESSEEEDEYIQKERAYQPQLEPEEKTLKQVLKMTFCEALTSKIVVVNYMSDDCHYVLKKLLALVEVFWESMKLLVISMPPDSTTIDTYYARKLCEQVSLYGGDLQVLFIRAEDKQDLISRVFKRERKKLTQLTEVKLNLELLPGTLLYAWGAANKGKLGLSQSFTQLKQLPGFYSECKSICAQQEYMTVDEDREQEEDGHRHQEQVFTPVPQPIIALMGTRIKQLSVGRDHCLALTAEGDVYAWGDNSKSQLGIIIGDEDSNDKKRNSVVAPAQPPISKSSKKNIHVTDEKEDLNEDGKPLSGSEEDTDAGEIVASDNSDDLLMFKNVIGVPHMVEGVKAKVNFIACGDYQSFASINLT